MKELVEEVLRLQPQWTHRNTPEMQRRGHLIRREICSWLQERLPQLGLAVGPAGHDLAIEGRDGTGPKSEIPWVRVYSASRSPSAHEGWYCVYLFRATGSGLYLTIAHGATRWSNGDFKPRPPEELRGLNAWARTIIGPTQHSHDIDLAARGNLAAAYERGTAIATFYPADAVPNDTQLEADLEAHLSLLGKLYDADDLGRSPEAASRTAEQIQSMVTMNGQGFGLSADERRAVERRAMELAAEYLVSAGYQVEDVSRHHPYDLTATKDGKTSIVEVKGTTGLGSEIILTANEVQAHQKYHPDNFLILVHSIALDRRLRPARAAGGVIKVLTPWHIDSSALVPLCFRYPAISTTETD